EHHLGRRAATATVLLLAFAPLSFFFTAVYTESLFLALAVGSMLAAQRGRFVLACALGALATLTRPVGILLAFGLVVGRLRAHGRPDRGLLGVLALPVTLLAYLGLLAARGYPWLSPFTAQTHWQRVTVGPLAAIVAAVLSAGRGVGSIIAGAPLYAPQRGGPLAPGDESIVLLAVLVICIAAFISCLRRLPLQYGVLAGAMLLVTLSSPAIGQPLWSFDRFALTMFPLWMAAGGWAARRRLVWPLVGLGATLLVFYTLQFASWAFVA
ncbi:MAG: hypothetical protein WBQ18_14180, partial [Solirubrobacteraceae bacterium]